MPGTAALPGLFTASLVLTLIAAPLVGAAVNRDGRSRCDWLHGEDFSRCQYHSSHGRSPRSPLQGLISWISVLLSGHKHVFVNGLQTCARI